MMQQNGPVKEAEGAEKRAYSRVSAYFQASWRLLSSPDEPQICPRQRGAEAGESGSHGPGGSAGSGQLAEVMRFMAGLDAKLDNILALLQKDSLNKSFPNNLMVVDLSAAGVLVQSDALRVGDFIELVMYLGEFPPAIVSGIGQVVRQGPVRFGAQTMAVSFVNLRDSDRERIVRYVFKEERERIRAERLR